MIIEAKVAGCIYTYFQHCIIVLRLLRGSFGSLGIGYWHCRWLFKYYVSNLHKYVHK